jgi:tRNA G18 (ribose-2'-O)-methylase SpoU
MRGYFGIGVEGLSKPMNAGNLYRSAHAFGASFVFTVASSYDPDIRKSDTSDVTGQVPFYSFETLESMRLPEGCALVGVEITDAAIDLPSFRHPRRAAYVLGMERGSLSRALVDCCDHVIKIPTQFSLNLASAGAIVMYDRLISVQRFGARPLVPGGPIEPIPLHTFGEPVIRRTRSRQKASSSTDGDQAIKRLN